MPMPGPCLICDRGEPECSGLSSERFLSSDSVKAFPAFAFQHCAEADEPGRDQGAQRVSHNALSCRIACKTQCKTQCKSSNTFQTYFNMVLHGVLCQGNPKTGRRKGAAFKQPVPHLNTHCVTVIIRCIMLHLLAQ